MRVRKLSPVSNTRAIKLPLRSCAMNKPWYIAQAKKHGGT
jgi:hypothetical protein